MYEFVLGAVNDRDLATIGVFFVGCAVGLAVFSNLLHWALERWSDTVMAGLIGLMVGSLRALWPWPDGTGPEQLGAPEGDVVVPVLLGLVGFCVVVGFSWVARRFEPAPEDELHLTAEAA
jgi:putative membrane protein